MAKKLNIDAIFNELSGGSAFFPSYKKSEFPAPSHPINQAVQPVPTHTPVSTQSPEPTARPDDEPANRPTDRPTGKRLLVRRGFEWWEDQLAALKKLSLEEQMAGEPGSMSAMVREALDDYLKKRAAKEPTG